MRGEGERAHRREKRRSRAQERGESEREHRRERGEGQEVKRVK